MIFTTVFHRTEPKLGRKEVIRKESIEQAQEPRGGSETAKKTIKTHEKDIIMTTGDPVGYNYTFWAENDSQARHWRFNVLPEQE